MKEVIVNKTLNYIIKHRKLTSYDIDIIRYGISNLYLQISKIIVITTLAIILKIFIPYLIFTIFYNIIRMPSFGIHAKKSWHCWVSSIIFFIGFPYLLTIINLNTYVHFLIAASSIIYITIYSPADTIKRPIISRKRRTIYKIFSFIISILYVLLSYLIKDKIVSYALLFSLVLQCIIISPITYKIFGMPYNNYKRYVEKEV